MRCYKCNSVLSDINFCNSCGTDVTLYKKIVKMSNTYYNMGLAKARVRDLSGAADLLRRSVRIDKRNVNARNLLGLVYFEMGECVAAFAEWVISKNIKPEKNVADTYLKAVQSNPNKLNLMNQSIKKYNIALEISARYKIPSLDIIKKAKARGIKFTFGTNNVDANFGRLEYSLEAVEKCGLTVEDMWFPTMSVRRERKPVIYNHFDASGKRVK